MIPDNYYMQSSHTPLAPAPEGSRFATVGNRRARTLPVTPPLQNAGQVSPPHELGLIPETYMQRPYAPFAPAPEGSPHATMDNRGVQPLSSIVPPQESTMQAQSPHSLGLIPDYLAQGSYNRRPPMPYGSFGGLPNMSTLAGLTAQRRGSSFQGGRNNRPYELGLFPETTQQNPMTLGNLTRSPIPYAQQQQRPMQYRPLSF